MDDPEDYDESLEKDLEFLSEFGKKEHLQLKVSHFDSESEESEEESQKQLATSSKNQDDDENLRELLQKQRLPACPIEEHGHNSEKLMSEINENLKLLNIVPDEVSIQHLRIPDQRVHKEKNKICSIHLAVEQGEKRKKNYTRKTRDSKEAGGIIRREDEWSPAPLQKEFSVNSKDYPALGK